MSTRAVAWIVPNAVKTDTQLVRSDAAVGPRMAAALYFDREHGVAPAIGHVNTARHSSEAKPGASNCQAEALFSETP